MFRLVCYDITNPKRLHKIAKICEGYGIRLQKSCFQCDTDTGMLKQLISDIYEVMNKETDSLLVYTFCDDCVRQSITDGPNKIIDPDGCIFL